MSQVTALVPTWRKRQLLCARCRTPVASDDAHICPDQVRSPMVELLLEQFREMNEMKQALSPGFAERVSLDHPWDFSQLDDHELEFTLRGVGLLVTWESLPPDERRVVSAILEHAGVAPTLFAA